jgi:hypothetical protein
MAAGHSRLTICVFGYVYTQTVINSVINNPYIRMHYLLCVKKTLFHRLSVYSIH